MAVALHRHHFSVVGELRFQPTPKRVRVLLADDLVADTTHSRLVWEPRRIVPAYAVPETDLLARLGPDTGPAAEEHPVSIDDGPPVLDPSSGFGVHTTPGRPLDVITTNGRAQGAAFRPDDRDLDGYVILDFDAFGWLEEDEPIVGHPRDPFSRIDIRRSGRHIRFELDGTVLADSTRPHLLFESGFPMARYYLPREDVRVELTPGTADTTCAYKGHATHYHARVGDAVVENIAWSYQDPLSDAGQVRGLVAFYQERLDLFVDGRSVPRPRTPWS